MIGSWIFGPEPRALPPETSSWWYRDVGQDTHAGLRIDEDNAMRLSVIKRCVELYASVIAGLPKAVYELLGGGRFRVATEHPLTRVLRDPNPSQTGYEHRHQQVGFLMLRGNYYDEILTTQRGAVGELQPIHPAHLRVDRVKATRRRVYDVSSQHDGRARVLTQDEIHHVHLLSLDGKTGLSPIGLMREGVGFAKSLELYGSRMLGHGMQPRGSFTSEQKFTKQQRDEIIEHVQAAHTGVLGWHKPLVLGGGLRWDASGLSLHDAEYILTRKTQKIDLATGYGVPLQLLNEQEKSSSWGTGVEQFIKGWRVFSVAPLVELIEARDNRDLLLDPDRYFIAHDMDAMLRGDSKERSEILKTQITHGIRNPDEARAILGLNPREDGRGDTYWRPANMDPDDGSTRQPRRRGNNGQAASVMPMPADDSAPQETVT